MTQSQPDAVNRLIVLLQRGLPLVERPFQALADRVGLSEEEILAITLDLLASGQARRFGGLFNSARMGFRTTLCAAIVPYERLDRVGERIALHNSVTHAYARVPFECLAAPDETDLPNLWFTVNAPEADFEGEVRALHDAVEPYAVYSLPARTCFKIGVVLDPGAGKASFDQKPTGNSSTDEPTPICLDREPDRSIVQRLQDSLPLTRTPYADLARACQCNAAQLIGRLRSWQQAGALRRIGLILRHQRAGFRANAMCVWAVDPEHVDRIGRDMATRETVTHCYARPRVPPFPYDLYAMVHGRDWDQTCALFSDLAGSLGLQNGRMLCSIREYRKASPRYIP